MGDLDDDIEQDWPDVSTMARELATIINGQYRVARSINADACIAPSKLADFLRAAIRKECEERIKIALARGFSNGLAWAVVKERADRNAVLEEAADEAFRWDTGRLASVALRSHQGPVAMTAILRPRDVAERDEAIRQLGKEARLHGAAEARAAWQR